MQSEAREDVEDIVELDDMDNLDDMVNLEDLDDLGHMDDLGNFPLAEKSLSQTAVTRSERPAARTESVLPEAPIASRTEV